MNAAGLRDRGISFGSETWVPVSRKISAGALNVNQWFYAGILSGWRRWTTIDNAIPAQARSYTWTVPPVVSTQALIRITRMCRLF
jgi:hypothetical protein